MRTVIVSSKKPLENSVTVTILIRAFKNSVP